MLYEVITGFGVGELLIFHNEPNTVAACAASETVVNLFLRTDDKAGRLLVMKGAGRFEVGTVFFEFDSYNFV